MRHGFIKVAAATPKIRVADTAYNAEQICIGIEEAFAKETKILVFPELCLTGYTCGDLFLQETLLKGARTELCRIVDYTKGKDILVFVGLPFEKEQKLYNVAAAIQNGSVLALIPKMNIPSYSEFYETRYFVAGNENIEFINFQGNRIPFGSHVLLQEETMEGLAVGCEICEDLWTTYPPATDHVLAGATIIANLSASSEAVGKDEYRELLVKSTSARLLCGYIYASSGEGESTQDMVFGGQNIIAENGIILKQGKRFQNEIIYTELDIHKISMERRRMNTFLTKKEASYTKVPFSFRKMETKLERKFECMPFVPSNETVRNKRCEEILSIQAYGLKKRYEHTGSRCAVVGVSGGLDSTLALLITTRTFDLLNLERKKIEAITMPCFGTTDRTYENACRLTKILGATLREVDLKQAVMIHFENIGQNPDHHDVTYENSQARERTQVLMDIANQTGGLVIGTGDMSELALGWATYNGDHMSMYGVNAGVPKTLVRYLVQYYADTCNSRELKEVLYDILDTPVSPELLPPVDGIISQKTEDLVGPYELHDCFLYYMLRCGFEPSKVYRISKEAFKGIYDEKTILEWMKLFYKRFFSQQFKRSCLPDGPKVGSVGLSPRGDLRMPSDACMRIWMDEIEKI